MITPESDVGLAQEEGDADTEQHRGDADGDVVDPGEAANRAVHRAERGARQARRKDADPWIAAMIGCGVANPGPEHRRPLEPKVDPA